MVALNCEIALRVIQPAISEAAAGVCDLKFQFHEFLKTRKKLCISIKEVLSNILVYKLVKDIYMDVYFLVTIISNILMFSFVCVC